MEPNNVVEKVCFYTKKNETVLGYLCKGQNNRFAKSISFFLGANQFSSRTEEVKGKRLTLEMVKGLEFLAKYFFLDNIHLFLF